MEILHSNFISITHNTQGKLYLYFLRYSVSTWCSLLVHQTINYSHHTSIILSWIFRHDIHSPPPKNNHWICCAQGRILYSFAPYCVHHIFRAILCTSFAYCYINLILIFINRIPVTAPLIGQEFGVFFYGGISPSKIGVSAPSW